MRPYQTTIWMYRILFGIGVASFIASVVMAILMRGESPATAIGTTALFGGLSIEEAALVLEVSTDIVKREWRTAKLWLLQELSSS